VYLGCLALIPALTSGTETINWLDGLGLITALAAIIIEAISDLQLRQFQKSNTDPQAIMKNGLWKFVRHPNYAGEILFWWGMYFFALAENTANRWMIVGPVCITALFFFISVPMIDRRMVARRPAYREHIKTTAGIFPGLKF